MSDPDAVFKELVQTFQRHSELAAAYRQSEQHYQKTYPHGGYICHEVVRHAWMKLTPEQQFGEMDNLFNTWFVCQMDMRKWLELEEKEPDGNTYLQHGDLEILDYIGEAVEDGYVPVEYVLLQRLISEVELLQHRLKMRAEAGGQS